MTNLAFALDLMETESKGRIVSSPRVITQNGQAATITDQSTRSFVQQTPQAGGIAVSQVVPLQATVTLAVTPKVTNEGSIELNVNINKGGFQAPEIPGELPQQTTKTAQTRILVDNGSTVSIGGIYTTEENTLESGIPFLKDLPIIGWLFKNGYNPTERRNELLIFITPRVINQEEAGLINRQLGEDLGV